MGGKKRMEWGNRTAVKAVLLFKAEIARMG
jgi:hypothetical protein